MLILLVNSNNGDRINLDFELQEMQKIFPSSETPVPQKKRPVYTQKSNAHALGTLRSLALSSGMCTDCLPPHLTGANCTWPFSCKALILLKSWPPKLALMQLLDPAKWNKTPNSPLLTELGKMVIQNTMICQTKESQRHALCTNTNVQFFSTLQFSTTAFMFSDQCSVEYALSEIVPCYTC